MVFSSIEFLLFFLPLFLIVYGLTPRKGRNVTLLSGSLIFYTLGEPGYLVLLMVSVLVNYFFGLCLGWYAPLQTENVSESVSGPGHAGNSGPAPASVRIYTLSREDGKNREKNYQDKLKQNRIKRKRIKQIKRRRMLFAAAVLFNVGLLVHFKYGLGKAYLPLGISFYTFQSLSYLTDVYRGGQKREVSFLRFASYIVMFPQLLSGPIVNYGEVRDALCERDFTLKGLQEGFKVFTMGLASKVLLADRIGLLWQEVQVTGFESISTPLAWMAAAAYSLKIYFDFYGYSLMAVGLGRMLGFELPENFRDPYMAVSVRDFYRRWHATLGRWFRQYVYIPLGGNRRGKVRTCINKLIVFFSTGLWHGANWTFVIWGMWHGLFMLLEEVLPVKKLPKVLQHMYAFLVVCIGFVMFRADTFSQGMIMIGKMFTGWEFETLQMTGALSVLTPVFLITLVCAAIGSMPVLPKLKVWVGTNIVKSQAAELFSYIGTVLLLVLCMLTLSGGTYNPFIYFRF